MDPATLVAEPLDGRRHDRAGFACGKPALDAYLARVAAQDARRVASLTWVLVEADAPEPKPVAGYLSPAAVSIVLDGIPESRRADLARYPEVPAVLIARLAVATRYHGRGIGRRLMREAFVRAHVLARAHAGAALLTVDPLDDEATRFHAGFGFESLTGSRRLFLTMTDVATTAAGRRRRRTPRPSHAPPPC